MFIFSMISTSVQNLSSVSPQDVLGFVNASSLIIAIESLSCTKFEYV